MWAFPTTHIIGLLGERTGLLFWASARGLGVSLGLPLLWAWRVGLRAYFSNPIKFLVELGFIWELILWMIVWWGNKEIVFLKVREEKENI